jgi:hypothetical protein
MCGVYSISCVTHFIDERGLDSHTLIGESIEGVRQDDEDILARRAAVKVILEQEAQWSPEEWTDPEEKDRTAYWTKKIVWHELQDWFKEQEKDSPSRYFEYTNEIYSFTLGIRVLLTE